MDIAYDEGHSYKLNSRSLSILKGEEKVELSAFISAAERKTREEERSPQIKTKTEIVRGELFEILRSLRKQIADSLGVPPYLVFNDRTLSEMAEKKPISNQQLLDVSGVGEEKLRRYGKVFLDEIAAHLTKNATKGAVLGKGKTYDATLLLFNDGKNVEEIAEARQMSPTTILGHLIKLKELGNDIDLRSQIDDWSFEAISKGIKELKMKPNDPAKLLFEHLGGDIDYGKIRLTMALYDWE
jgi:ATP-dependent DNA helicase RecQ